jgi:hypothetical protein
MSTFTTVIQKDLCPIVLLDCSGSTEHSIDVNKYFSNVDTVLKYEINTCQRILKSKGINQMYLILWNFKSTIYSEKPILVDDLTKCNIESLGGTVLSKGLESIPEEWIDVKGGQRKEMYVFTDGEIEDENIVANPLKKLIDGGIVIQIITIEPNSINYIESKGDAGHKLFQVIKTNGLTQSLRRFSSYNEYHVKEPFISFDNPEIIEGYAPFQGEYFNVEENKDDLVDKVEESINECKTKEELVKLAHDLTVTIHHMVKDKPVDEQLEINNEFADLFAETDIDHNIFTQVNKMLMLEVGNHSKGSASSYQDFKDALVCI